MVEVPGSAVIATAIVQWRTAVTALWRATLIGLIAFLTLVDLFATQAILPMLAEHYRVTPAAMGLAVNATTVGMAIASLAVAFASPKLDKRSGIVLALALLAIPTLLLAVAPNLVIFAGLRIAQGLCMATAFALTLAHLGERCSLRDKAGAFAAYITGNVASNLVGRLVAAAFTDHFGLAANFALFAGLNLTGAVLVLLTIDRTQPSSSIRRSSPFAALGTHLAHPGLRAAFAIGFCILFAFIGVFTYVNFVLVRPPIAIGMMGIGVVYVVFLPSILTTPLAGHAVARLGTRRALWAGLGVAGLGLPLVALPSLGSIVVGMVLVAIGTFLAQAVATGYVGHEATTDRAAASGLYLSSYFCGGIVGTAVLGTIFDAFGWPATVLGIGGALLAAAFLALRLESA